MLGQSLFSDRNAVELETLNKGAYKERGIVKDYGQRFRLQPPEQTILNIFRDRLPSMKMLDIGIGGGRTTLHFAQLAKEYVGVDYSEEMVERFPDPSPHISFSVCDAREMRMFADNTFDFVMFSFNGIDSVSHEDRFRVFSEIQRVGKSGGYFCFSTHNIQCMYQEFELKSRFSLNPIKTLRNLTRRALLYQSNPLSDIENIRKFQHLILADGAHGYRLKNYYIKPAEQIRQLQDYLLNIQVYSLTDGQEIVNEAILNSIQDPWLYFLGVIR
jgi:ubiquinone/menaquinone biosynthesis C-methylase UbiE